MSRQTLISIGVLLLVFGSGIGLGLFFGGGSSTSHLLDKNTKSDSSGFSSQEAQERVEQNTILSRRIMELEKEAAEQKKVDKAKACFEFFQKHPKWIRVEPFDRNTLKVSPEMVELMGLTDKEQQAITAHLRDTENQIKQIMAADTTVPKQEGNKISYEIAADPRGKDLKDQLVSDLSADVGADRADMLMNFGDFSEYSSFNDFSQAKRAVALTWEQKDGHTQYTQTTSYYRPDGTQSGSMTSTVPDSAPPEFQKYLPSGTPTAMPPTVTR